MLFHTIPPIYDENSNILILGSFPSVKSRETEFYYGNPKNRFWKILSDITGYNLPATKEEKIKLLKENRIALWDVINSCEIKGSSDSTIKNVIPNDIKKIIEFSDIKYIFLNGKTAGKLWFRYFYDDNYFRIPSEILPSTSPANAGYTYERLLKKWSVIKNVLVN